MENPKLGWYVWSQLGLGLGSLATSQHIELVGGGPRSLAANLSKGEKSVVSNDRRWNAETVVTGTSPMHEHEPRAVRDLMSKIERLELLLSDMANGSVDASCSGPQLSKRLILAYSKDFEVGERTFYRHLAMIRAGRAT